MTNTHTLLGATANLSATEKEFLIAFLVGYNPEAVQAALTHVETFRTYPVPTN